MLYFGNPSSQKIRDAMNAGEMGAILTPKQGNKLPDDTEWIADNGCFGKGYPGDEAWTSWLTKLVPHKDRCLFATAPDVVGDAAATLARSAPWLVQIRNLGYRAALVAQNGLTLHTTPWDTFDTLFLGGSAECLPCGYIKPITDLKRQTCPTCGGGLEEWKLSRAAHQLAAEAKRRGKGLHMGRVNSGLRWGIAEFMGCDSVDGTFLAFGPDKNLVRMREWARQMSLFSEAA